MNLSKDKQNDMEEYVEDVKSCILCKYCDENYHAFKLFCVYHNFWIDDYNICNKYEV